MSFIIDENDPVSPEVGQTSADAPDVDGKKGKKAKKKKAKKTKTKKAKKEKSGDSFKRNINVWDVMLVISLICIAYACFLCVMELRSFSNFPFSYPWKTTDANF